MCAPEHFAVTYAINPWMEPEKPTDAANARRQWARLRQVYLWRGEPGPDGKPRPAKGRYTLVMKGAGLNLVNPVIVVEVRGKTVRHIQPIRTEINKAP